ncbi:NlpC/P60 family protein [Streptomyces sp. N2-109]|uniref:NlpC/P60 family protein n=1 Tax=Streptomyces gossypii TaxID=2883101 RepID=A0ABT2JZJ4_9ACTN|nr:C40 family peptidase [Streptomyces gossypii]MCT2593318.1 NlpC/P60 family protein [Streptomyces gossypii]
MRATVLTAAAGVVAALATAPAGAEPDDLSAAQAGVRVDRLYAQAERVTEKYNGAAEQVAELREELSRVQERAARGQQRVNRLRGDLGALAGAQYRSGGLHPTLALLLSEDPGAYLSRAAALERISGSQSEKLRQFEGARRTLGQAREEGDRKLERLERQRGTLRAHKKTVQTKLASARRLLHQLSPQERAERERTTARGTSGPQPGAQGGPGASSARAAAAVAAARGALGSPYAWGQAGPGAFDCSGLTQWAYRQAGVSLPRTSQAQASAGRRVPLSEARPGDLVIYRADASHVGMYVGGGQVVHAPYPGAQVRYEAVGMLPVSAVARP